MKVNCPLPNRSLKIGITCYPTLGGSGVVATELGKLLAEHGHQIHFITPGVPFRLGKFYPNIYYHEVEVNQYEVFRYPPYDLTLASKMAQVANREKLDLLHVHYAIPHAVCAILARQMVDHPLKVVTTLHGTDITVLAYDETLKEMIRYGIEQSDLVTAVSDHLINETYELLHINKDIYKVYNFVDLRQYERSVHPLFRKQYAPNGEKLVVHISNFRPVKRVLDVAKVFQLILREIPAKLIFIGEGPDFPRVCHWLKEHHLDSYVHFLGKQDDVAEILSQTDLMLLPSEKESFGLVALEAMACGVPVIASNTGGIPEVIAQGQTGLIYPVGDIEGMAHGAVTLLSQPDVYRRFSQAALERTRTQFAADIILEQYLTLYQRVLNG
ncbi:N-acetyl-alpha-D-glucosaminyl L-malate synthase BshA [Caldalkalibacillus uzonensis]|uniref:N-acetyl-alpha-D-glucosaminyl L-malate synthase BshA n=1 Tax=Caldalkalibacillus uzonensis TaxID=353224 RepID=A0ABU0CMI4_9BACI|nr:N-acetyl-alpha-D-glucosaminyl L-malate synthase BshA [Caldalkalibacillus uzonensis]MDQ0337628.1 N-acetyl-alpha-D-glucosaminyl L-malate synthase BshA [Caldalkalibacillus uzonensis]